MKKRFFTVFLILNVLGFFNSCFPPCPPEKYFDYSSIKARVINPNVLLNEKLTFGFLQEDIIYLVERSVNFNFSYSAYATSICEKGYEGEKYKLIRISIKSNNDFNSDFPAGSELNSLVQSNGLNSNNEQIVNTINNLNPATVNTAYMRIESKPSNIKKHKFTIEIEKSNNEILKTTTEEITFQ